MHEGTLRSCGLTPRGPRQIAHSLIQIMLFRQTVSEAQSFTFSAANVSPNVGQVLSITNVGLCNPRESGTLLLKKGSESFIVAVLDEKRPQVGINLFISLTDEIKFKVKGKATLHILGFFEPQKNVDAEGVEKRNPLEMIAKMHNGRNQKTTHEKQETKIHDHKHTPQEQAHINHQRSKEIEEEEENEVEENEVEENEVDEQQSEASSSEGNMVRQSEGEEEIDDELSEQEGVPKKHRKLDFCVVGQRSKIFPASQLNITGNTTISRANENYNQNGGKLFQGNSGRNGFQYLKGGVWKKMFTSQIGQQNSNPVRQV